MTGLNPECQQGKHANCDSLTWDDRTDAAVDCPCSCHGGLWRCSECGRWCPCRHHPDAPVERVEGANRG